MGFTPAQVSAMSLWEFAVCLDGFNKANGVSSRPEIDDETMAVFEAAGVFGG